MIKLDISRRVGLVRIPFPPPLRHSPSVCSVARPAVPVPPALHHVHRLFIPSLATLRLLIPSHPPLPPPVTATSTSTTPTTSTTSTSPTSTSTPPASTNLATTTTTSASTPTSTGTSTTLLPSTANQVQDPSSSNSSSSNTGAIVGGVVGGVVFLSCVALGLFLYMRHRRRKRIAPSSEFINSLRPGVAPVFMLESSPSQVEKSQQSHYLSSPPYPTGRLLCQPLAKQYGLPDSTMSTDHSPGLPKREKPLVPNRYSAQQAAANSRYGRVDAEDRRSTGSGEWDGDPVIEAPRRMRSRRPESVPASAHRSNSSHHPRSHQYQSPIQHSYPGVSPLAVSQPQISGFDRSTNRDELTSPPPSHRAVSLRPQRREDYERVWEERQP
ncbi:hypothetical protein EDC04DRAFT_2961902 [Pisolithus marmoratus]|nr:hypothetical protein EDC04DRAFT_2961902 [Pisolithus marmoratus]